MPESRGSIAFFGTYRPPVPLDIFSLPANPPPSSWKDELLLTDGESYNQNCEPIPAAALGELLTFLGKSNPKLASECGATRPDDAAKGLVTGLLFVSERDNGLETLHVALRFNTNDGVPAKVKVLSLADIYGADIFGGARMEDSGCIAGGFQVGPRSVGHSLVYVSTKERVIDRRTPWTVVYKTNLADGSTERLTPPGQYDLSPAVSPSGKLVAVANFKFNEWTGEIENLKTDIVVMNVDRQAQGGLGRRIVIKDGGWPTWGSDNVLFFHRGLDTTLPNGTIDTSWRVFRYDITTGAIDGVTPPPVECWKAVTPAAISETKVAVATIRQKSNFSDDRVEAQYRHIEIFDVQDRDHPVGITLKTRPKADHYNPFVLDGGRRIGYHRCRTDKLELLLKVEDEDEDEDEDEEKSEETGTGIQRKFDKVQPPETHTDVGLFRVSGVFPTISRDGKKLAFVDNAFKSVWLADSQGLRVVHKVGDEDLSIFSTSWNQNDALDTLYMCEGPAFSVDKTVQILALVGVSGPAFSVEMRRLTDGKFNNAFPSSSPDGTKLVFRSTRDRLLPKEASPEQRKAQRKLKNLFIMDAIEGEFGGVGDSKKAKQLTDGEWTDTHCSWSPTNGCDWIVFSSTRDKPKKGVTPLDQGLDPGYFAVYLVSAKNVKKGGVPVPVRVVRSSPTFAGHINHPVFSPDMRSIVFAADLAAVSADPISMPYFLHSVRPYGDIFSIDLRDAQDMAKNEDIKTFHRITHSRYEYSTPAWADGDHDHSTKWKLPNDSSATSAAPGCPYAYPKGGEGWNLTGHLTLSKRCC